MKENEILTQIHREREILKKMSKKDVIQYAVQKSYFIPKRFTTKKALIQNIMEHSIVNILKQNNMIV
jgi:hypothetical protein